MLDSQLRDRLAYRLRLAGAAANGYEALLVSRYSAIYPTPLQVVIDLAVQRCISTGTYLAVWGRLGFPVTALLLVLLYLERRWDF